MSTIAVNDPGHMIIDALIDAGAVDAVEEFENLGRRFRHDDKSPLTKSDLLEILNRDYKGHESYPWLQRVLRKAPIRSLSGITSVTVLTKPFPCPGKCVFCPVDVRMPKSYIATEPGALRAGRLGFDPYQQVAQRLQSYVDMGHPVAKIEFIVLGGTWSAYPRDYQLWFVKRMFEALNDFGIRRDEPTHAYPTDWDARIKPGETYDKAINNSQYVKDAYVETATQEELDFEHKRNEDADFRCVGLSLETRPDLLDEQECVNLRSLGATKIQIGIQSLDNEVLKMNKRGHTAEKSELALRLLRRFGFKVHAHWMPNLYGATAAKDIIDYAKVFDNIAIRPDELKVYPTALIQDTELERIAEAGKWNAYSEDELRDVLSYVLTHTPEYSRITRMIRDIPSSEILAGNKKGNFRQIVEQGIDDKNTMHDIRAREIRNQLVAPNEVVLEDTVYETTDTIEHFLQWVRPSDRKIAAFLRLSLPIVDGHPHAELDGEAIIREVHVYGQSVALGDENDAAQHQGLGRKLINEAKRISANNGFEKVAVISAIGTRRYYEKLDFEAGPLYHHIASA